MTRSLGYDQSRSRLIAIRYVRSEMPRIKIRIPFEIRSKGMTMSENTEVSAEEPTHFEYDVPVDGAVANLEPDFTAEETDEVIEIVVNDEEEQKS